VARTRYLADTSVFARLAKPPVTVAFAPLAVQGQVAMCSPWRSRLIILHYDADFELVAEVTGQQQQWVVTRGTAD
jgi:predicted nucleic acid-binding protein